MKKLLTFVFMAIMIAACNTTSHVSNAKDTHPQSDKEYWYNANFKAGNDFYNRKKWRKAEKAFKKAAEYKQDFAVNYNIGLTAYQRENYQDAINYFQASLNYRHNQTQEDKAKSMLEKSRVARQKQIQRRQEIAKAVTLAVVAGATAAVSASVKSSTGVSFTDPQYQGWQSYRNSGLPGASTISFEDYKKANARAAAHGYQIGGSSCSTSSSSCSSSHTSSSNSSKNTSRRKCGFCGGRGWTVEYATGFGLAKSEYCQTCGKDMMSNHYHATCQKCGGTGYEK